MNTWQNSQSSFNTRKNNIVYYTLATIWIIWLFGLHIARAKEPLNTEKHLFQYTAKEPHPENPKTITTVQEDFSWIVMQSYHEIQKSITYLEHCSDDNKKEHYRQQWKEQLANLVNRLHKIDKRNYEKYNFKESVFNEKIDWAIIAQKILWLWRKLWRHFQIPRVIIIEHTINTINNEELVKN